MFIEELEEGCHASDICEIEKKVGHVAGDLAYSFPSLSFLLIISQAFPKRPPKENF